MTNDLKLKIYPAVIGILGVCLLASLLFNVEVQIDRGTPATTVPSEPQPLEPDPSPVDSSLADPSPVPSPSPEAISPAPLATPTLADTQTIPVVDPNIKGGLRVSNQTEFPLRVALLHQQPEATTIEASTGKAFNQPVHWDFAPGEGKSKGLILSLPNDNLELQTGDVLVAFALDGSRRYWGPYVVGQTSTPVWNGTTEEWQLILQP